MVCNGQCLVPPRNSLSDNIPDIRNAVHVAHFRMAVQLHALFRACVHPVNRKIRDFLNAGNRAYRQLAVEAVKRRHAPDF